MTASSGIHGDFWPIAGTLQFQPTETEKTISVQIVDDSVEDDGETFLLDLAEASGATMDDRTSFGTGTIRNSEDAPTGNENTLTASFANVPADHGGSGEANRFSFDLSFSENPKVGYRTLRDHAFQITGGDVKKAKRKVKGSNQSWTITVEPDGWGDVNITLPGNRACSANNAVCMPDGRQLSNSPSATISGPAALSIADATANENSDSGLNFVLSEVAPLWWTPEHCAEEVSTCRRNNRRTRRSTGARWSSWFARAARPGSWPASSSAPLRRSATGCVKRIATRAVVRTV